MWIIDWMLACNTKELKRPKNRKPNTETTLITQPFYLFLHYIRERYQAQTMASMAQNFSDIRWFVSSSKSNLYRFAMSFVICEWESTHDVQLTHWHNRQLAEAD